MTDTQSPTKLKACPFCGGEVEMFAETVEGDRRPLVSGHALMMSSSDVEYFGVRCRRCEIGMTNPTADEQDAAAAWNTRTPEAAEPVVSGEIDKAVERMGEALYHLSDQLRGSDWLANEAHRQTYEIVVREWSVLTDALSTRPAEPPQDVVERLQSRLDYNVGSKDRSQLVTSTETIVKKDDLRAVLAALTASSSGQERLERALLMCAAHCQGGHSGAGQAAADALEMPFPITMENLRLAALSRGFEPAKLWPWMKAFALASKEDSHGR
jgi:hypothetical protein